MKTKPRKVKYFLSFASKFDRGGIFIQANLNFMPISTKIREMFLEGMDLSYTEYRSRPEIINFKTCLLVRNLVNAYYKTRR